MVLDDLPPDQLLADDTESDFCSEDILNVNEEDFDDFPLLKVDQYRDEDYLVVEKVMRPETKHLPISRLQSQMYYTKI